MSGWSPDCLVGVKRGGLVPATLLSHYMNVPMFVSSCRLRDGRNEVDLLEVDQSFKNKRILVVDDICDEGHTLEKLSCALRELEICDFKTCSLFFNIRQNFAVDFKARKIDRFKDNSWIVFPWEI